ncbi:NGP1NT-domain-containing protein [Schizophyllum commune H4-8]|uniref:Nucleolar GTP-binding protein 2 n=1 Tax=Schizophyllum commune (strain H4-8 / FGSC 9210) TaxID=578458 RepID=D8PM03_SCHCM|nr:NGP1NT-domain-containing protein [Schizophyllum commune H4-8]KAI5885467.1 NGP1NT-domain-containing protein [Schizophyllum commune H4-8]
MAPSSKNTGFSAKPRLSASQISLKRLKGEDFERNAKQVSRFKMLNGGKPFRDEDGKVTEAAALEKGAEDTKPGRVQRDGWWFGNTWVISQTAFDHCRTSPTTKKDDPYSVLLRRNKLPVALLDDAANPNTRKLCLLPPYYESSLNPSQRSVIVETKPFSNTFGPKAQRKRPRVEVGSFAELADAANEAAAKPEEGDLTAPVKVLEPQTHADFHEPIYAKGTSRRIYGELYKVIDFSDVILHVLDARDWFIKKEKAHKQVVLVINKCDLVPNWVTARYIQHLTPRYPTIAFHASPNHSFGKGSLIQLPRQFSQLHSDKKQISVGFVG